MRLQRRQPTLQNLKTVVAQLTQKADITSLDKLREQFPSYSRRFLSDMLLRDVQANCLQDVWEQEYWRHRSGTTERSVMEPEVMFDAPSRKASEVSDRVQDLHAKLWHWDMDSLTHPNPQPNIRSCARRAQGISAQSLGWRKDAASET